VRFIEFMKTMLMPRVFGALTNWNFGSKQESGVYAAPKLYLGRALLMMTGTKIAS